MKREGRKKGVRKGGTSANETKKRECEREGLCVDAFTYVYIRVHAFTRRAPVQMCVHACACACTTPHCGLKEVERIRENRVSFRSASARGLGPFVLSSRNSEEEEEEEEDNDDEEEEEEEEEDQRGGYLSYTRRKKEKKTAAEGWASTLKSSYRALLLPAIPR